MGLRKSDQEWIYEAIKDGTRKVVEELLDEHLPKLIEEAVKKALSAEIHMEQERDPETGQKLAHTKVVKEEIFLPAFFCQHLKFHEGAYRGFQEDINKTNNRVRGAMMANKAIAKILLCNQKSMESLARFATALKQSRLLERMEEVLQIESDSGR